MLRDVARAYDPNSKLSVVGAMLGAAGAIMVAGFCLLFIGLLVFAFLSG